MRDAGSETDRVPPQSVEAEQSVLGALLLDNSAFDVVADVVREADFYTQDHRLIFAQIVRLIEAGRPADTLTVGDGLKLAGKLEEVGGAAYLGLLAANTPSAANVRRYAEIVADRSIMRQLASAGSQITLSAYEPKGRDAKALLDAAQQAVMAVGESSRSAAGDFETAEQVMGEVLAFVDGQHERRARGEMGDVVGVPTGFLDLDRETTGLQPGELVLLAARPSMGKSSLALNICENAARETGRWALFFNLEMSNRSQGLRLLGSGSQVHVQRLVTGRVADGEWARVSKSAGDMRGLKIAFSYQPGLTIQDLRARSRRAVRAFGKPSLIVVDYLQLMLYEGNDLNKANQIGDISRGLKLLAGELETPVMALSQLNRSLEQRQNKRPIMSDLRDSGALEQDADVILFIYRDEVYHPNSAEAGKAEVIIAKQRNGPTCTVPLRFRGDFTRFDNYAGGA